jgi:hypothetical protein
VLHLLLVVIGQLKLLVLFLLLALVLNKSRYVLRKICKRSHNYRQTVLEFKYVKRATFYCQTSPKAQVYVMQRHRGLYRRTYCYVKNLLI